MDPIHEALPPQKDIPLPVDGGNIDVMQIPAFDVDTSSLVSEEPDDEAMIEARFLPPLATDCARSKAAIAANAPNASRQATSAASDPNANRRAEQHLQDLSERCALQIQQSN
eukprot:135633-Amphidinium_carterae.8